MRPALLLLLAACGGPSDELAADAHEASCDDELDDDHDGRVDCNDFDCASSAACGGTGDTEEPPGDDTDAAPGDDTDAGGREDVVVIAGNASTDLLLVVDNSASATDGQERLAAQIAPLLTVLTTSGVPWHVGVVTTDTDDLSQNGKLQGADGYTWLDGTVAAPLPILQDMVRVGGDGSSSSRGRRAAHRAITQPTAAHQRANAGFLQGGAMHLLVLSNGVDASGSDPTSADFISLLQAWTGGPVSFSSLVGPAGGCADAESGSDYLAISAALGGTTASYCDADWGPALIEVANRATGVPDRYPLSGEPDPDTLRPFILDGAARFDGQDASRGDPCDTPICFTYVYEAAPPRFGIRVTGLRPRAGAELHLPWDPPGP
ncbi:MAG TPA: hypothetical protein PKA64_18280 [Myxococcota bacterium]|nr:hypothetical protein [Myxococcota bacterium]